MKFDSALFKSFTTSLRTFFSSRFNIILTLILCLVLLGGMWGVSRLLAKNVPKGILPEQDLAFTPDGPYARLIPRRDGKALILNIFRVSDYDAISYELAYESTNDAGEIIDRGVTGKINTKSKKSEYSQEILFGTCSKGNTADPLHCVFDKNVENGTLTLHILKGRQPYRMIITWHLQRPDIALGKLVSGDSHFIYTIKQDGSDEDYNTKLVTLAYSIINDLTGVPKLPDNKKVFGTVYAVNIPPGKSTLPGTVSIQTADPIPQGSKIAHYNQQYNKWDILDTQVKDSSASAQVDSTGIFAILSSGKN